MEKNILDEKLYTVKTKCSENTHLAADVEKCRSCTDRCCLHICPANVYSWDEEGNCLNIAYENCLECGACRIACGEKALDWKYPQSGCGITYRYS